MPNTEKITAKINDLSSKIDTLYALETLLNEMNSYLYDKGFKYDENGSILKDENDDYIYEITDSPKNKLVTELIDYLTKKYL